MGDEVMRRLCAIVPLLALLVAGCALTEDSIEVRYGAVRGTAPVAGASAVAITVAGRDGRTQHRDRVSVKKNGYGMEMARIVASNDVVRETERAIAGELTARGFREPGDDARIEVEVIRFYNDFKIGFWSGAAEAEIIAQIRVTGRDGAIAYTRTYSMQHRVEPVFLANGENAALALQGALQRLVQSVMDDPALIAALVARAPGPARRGRPVAAAAPVAG